MNNSKRTLKSDGKSILGFVICGMEHTGTTLISDLFRQVPGVDAGFEVGVLLCNSPRDFPRLQPFADNILAGWGINKKELEACCNTDSPKEFYLRLKNASRILSVETTVTFDKTPRYISELDRILNSVEKPIVVSYKDPRALVFSDFKRANATNFEDWYARYLPGKLGYVKTCYASWQSARENSRVCSVSLEELAMNARHTMERMFLHVGQKFRLEYALLDGLRYQNTRANVISAEIAFEFKRNLSTAEQARIEKDFTQFGDWFYD